MIAWSARPRSAQVKTNVPDVVAGARPAIVERIKIHGTALEGNLEGDAVDRDAIVFLPPSYNQNRTRRYPVVYALHGYSIGAEQWSQEIHVPQTIEGAFAKGAHEMIVVLPDSKTVHNGSMYSSSVTTGDFENYVARDVVAYIDAHYRTIADAREPRPGRPLDGRLRRHPHRHEARRRVRQPVHHEPVLPVGARQRRRPRRSGRRNAGERRGAGRGQDAGGLGEAAVRPARAAGVGGGLVAEPEESAALSRSADRRPGSRRSWRGGPPTRRWRSSTSTSRSCGGIAPSRSTSAIRTACASTPASCTTCSIRYGIANTFEIYPGTHTSDVAVRFQEHVMPFFSRTLSFEPAQAMRRFGLARRGDAARPSRRRSRSTASRPCTIRRPSSRRAASSTSTPPATDCPRSCPTTAGRGAGPARSCRPCRAASRDPTSSRAAATTRWAPDIIRVGDKYFLYYSAPGTQPKSADRPARRHARSIRRRLTTSGRTRGPVVWSDGVEDSNAIDPGVLRDPTNGTLWLTYGSYFGYIRLVELDPKTGKRLHPERASRSTSRSTPKRRS